MEAKIHRNICCIHFASNWLYVMVFHLEWGHSDFQIWLEDREKHITPTFDVKVCYSLSFLQWTSSVISDLSQTSDSFAVCLHGYLFTLFLIDSMTPHRNWMVSSWNWRDFFFALFEMFFMYLKLFFCKHSTPYQFTFLHISSCDNLVFVFFFSQHI